MNTPKLDVDSLIEALRGDLPSEREEARVRARLIAAGVIAATAMTTAEVSAASLTVAGAATKSMAGSVAGAAGAATSSATGAAALGAGTSVAPLAALPVGLAQAGLWAKVIALPLAAKIGIAGTVAVGVAAGSVPALHELQSAANERATAALVERAPEPGSPSKTSSLPRAVLPVADDRALPQAESAAVGAPEAPTSAPSIGAAAPRANETRRELDARGPAEIERRPRAANALGTAAASLAGVRASAESPHGAQGTRAARMGQPESPRANSANAAAPAPVVAEKPGAASAASVSSDAPAVANSAGGAERAEIGRAGTPNAYASASTLAEETGLMERAIAALHDGDLALARYWLSEHERRFPHGLLTRERLRALANVERQAR